MASYDRVKDVGCSVLHFFVGHLVEALRDQRFSRCSAALLLPVVCIGEAVDALESLQALLGLCRQGIVVMRIVAVLISNRPRLRASCGPSAPRCATGLATARAGRET